MLETVKGSAIAKILLILFIVYTIWWLLLNFTGSAGTKQYNVELFTNTYGIIAAIGGIAGIFIASRWGLLKSVMGKSIIFFSLGLLAQEFGQLSYAYYIYILHIGVPYPSVGDIGYFGSVILYILGIYHLSIASGAKIGLRLFFSRLQAIIIPLIILIIAYLFFLKGYVFDWTAPVKIFLDFGYPFGEAFYISLAILTFLLSRGVLGGLMKKYILSFIFALVVQFIADFSFLYQSNQGTWAPGGINDFIYVISYTIMSISLLQLYTVYLKSK